MQYYTISPIQKVELAVSVRTILLNQYLDSKNIIFLTILFFFWLYLTKLFTNAVMFQFIYNKLNPYN